MDIPLQASRRIKRPYKKVERYKECLKNHAATICGKAIDGCGEFIPGEEEGSLEAPQVLNLILIHVMILNRNIN
ncbi:hypothetical protein Peur_057032 [Populus x canadensis]|jgi:ZF-HD homeobox protein with Cys/His-rich dimerization domain